MNEELIIVKGKEPEVTAVHRWEAGNQMLVFESADKARRWAEARGSKFSDQRKKKRKL